MTGGGTNLGKAAAQELLHCGARVIIAGRREDVLAQAAVELGDGCSWATADIREAGQARQLVQTALERHGRLDVLLNNAGGQYFVAAEQITAKGWRAVQRLNVDGTLTMSEAAYEHAMRPAREGMIINTTVSPHHGMPAMAHTGAARAAVEALTRDLARAWSDDGVAVAAIALGRFATESLRKYPAQLWRRAAATVPMQRLGDPREYGWLVAMLATDLGRGFSGSVLTLDGGLDNWTGPWPPPELTPSGEVPTESRGNGA